MPAPDARQRREHGEIGIGLDRIADKRVLAGEGVGEDAVVTIERRRRIAIEWRADGGGKLGKADILGVEDALPVSEMVHGGSGLWSAGAGGQSKGAEPGACDILVCGSAFVSG